MPATTIRQLGDRPSRVPSPFNVSSGEMTRRHSMLASDLAQLPAGWEVYNAPRPLLGHLTWQGESLHGLFYAAIDPSDGRLADDWRQRNLELDGWLIEYLPRAETLHAYAAEMMAEYAGEADVEQDIAKALKAALAGERGDHGLGLWLEDSWRAKHGRLVDGIEQAES